MRQYKTDIIIALAFGMVGCGDFLKEVSQDEFEPKTTSSFQELMNGEGYISSPVDPMTYMMDDDVQGGKGSLWNEELSARQAIFEWQPDFWQVEEACTKLLGVVKYSYRNIYKTIAACNIIIENLPGSGGSQADKDITMADLKGTLNELVHRLYGPETRTRFRPHHFPFTEPSCEVDIECFECHGAGCRMCKGEGWIELLGAGMVHPKVLEGCGIDTGKYSGFAFGVGAERMGMFRFGISDLRLMFENDTRFLEQF